MSGLLARCPEFLKRVAAMFAYFLGGEGSLIEMLCAAVGGIGMLRRAAVLFVSIFALIGFASAQSNSEPQTQTPSKQLMQDVWNGWATLDTANVSRFYDKNANDTFFDVTPLKYKGWSQYESGVKSVFAQWQTMKATVNDDAEVHANGSLYWGTTTVHLNINPKEGNPMELDIRWTVLWQKQGKQWLIIHEHASAPLK